MEPQFYPLLRSRPKGLFQFNALARFAFALVCVTPPPDHFYSVHLNFGAEIVSIIQRHYGRSRQSWPSNLSTVVVRKQQQNITWSFVTCWNNVFGMSSFYSIKDLTTSVPCQRQLEGSWTITGWASAKGRMSQHNCDQSRAPNWTSQITVHQTKCKSKLHHLLKSWSNWKENPERDTELLSRLSCQSISRSVFQDLSHLWKRSNNLDSSDKILVSGANLTSIYK